MPNRVKQFSLIRILILIFIGLLSLGQLQRLQITSNIAVYAHELLIAILFSIALAQSNAKAHILQFFNNQKPLILFIAILGFSLLVNSLYAHYDPRIPGLYFLRLVLYVTLIPTFTIFKESIIPKKSGLLLVTILGSGLAVGGLIQYLFFPDARSLTLLGWDNHLYRSIGTILDPNFLGILMVLTLLIAINWKTKLQNLLIITTTLCLFLTYSRASFLAALIGFLVWGAQTKKFIKIIIIALIFLTVIVLLPRRGGEGNRLERIVSISHRLESFQNGLEVFKSSPIIGVGYNAYQNYLPKNPKYSFIPSHPSAPDNSYLLIVATSGLIGGLSFLNLIWAAWNKWKHNPIILPSVTAIGVHGLFNNTLFFPWIMVWLALLIVFEDKS